jgi:hypothetical protein
MLKKTGTGRAIIQFMAGVEALKPQENGLFSGRLPDEEQKNVYICAMFPFEERKNVIKIKLYCTITK